MHRTLLLSLLVLSCGIFQGGCNKATVTPPNAPTSAYQAMMAHANEREWGRAATLIEKVLIESPGDAEVLENTARVATFAENKTLAAELLVEACEVTQYADPNRVQQAFVGLLAVGRLFDAMELLERVLELHPDKTETRQMLHSFYVGTERHREAAEHARVLIRQRAFDVPLLQSLGDVDPRTQEADSLAEMTKRNPDDLRPLIGKARFHFDRGEFGACIDVLDSIVGQHPDDVVAQVLLGRALILGGQRERLSGWAERLPPSVEAYSDYWLTLGDVAVSDNAWELARDAYSRAAQRDWDQVQVWDKFAMAMQQTEPNSSDLQTIAQRAQQLTKLRQRQADFDIGNEKNAASFIDIADLLAQLGRLWEAEAWLAIGQVQLAQTAPAAVAELNTRRLAIARQLTKQTPWHTTLAIESWQRSDQPDADALVDRILGSSHRTTAPDPVASWSRPLPFLLDDEAKRRGLDFLATPGNNLDQPGIRIHRTLGCGGAAIDFDMDGWPDIYLATAGGTPPHADSPPNALFRNVTGTFRNVSATSGCDDRGFGQGVAVGDLNADGFDDLLVLNYGPNRVFINNGDGTFQDATERWLAGQDPNQWSTSAAIADLDGDSIVDAVITNYASGLAPSQVDCDSEGVEGHRSCSPMFFPAEPDLFLQGQADARWIDTTESWNAKPAILGRGLGIVVGTFAPGRINDVYIVNDMTSNHYWTPQRGSQPFRLVETAGINGLANDAFSRTQGSMGIATHDFNGDGTIDFYVTNFDNETNSLYLSRSEASWLDETLPRGLGPDTLPMVGFGSKAVDLDGNGSVELLVTNGHVDIFDGPKKKAAYDQPFQIFTPNANGTFTSVGAEIESAYFQSTHVGRALFVADVNRDGKQDFIVTHQTEPVALLVNQTATPYRSLRIRCVATKSERNAIGTRVEVRHPGGSIIASVTSGDGYFCSDERRLTFGIGESTSAIEVTVHWPSGGVDTYSLSAEHEWLIVEKDQPFPLSH